jgi:hypothetical protein
MRFSTIKRALTAFDKATTPGAKIMVLLFSVVVVSSVVNAMSEAYNNHIFNRLSATEHLNLARDMCRSGPAGDHPGICLTDEPDKATHHLEAIPRTSPEYREAAELLLSIGEQERARARALAKEQSETALPKASDEQKGRDENAQLSSYWPTTIRVDTDMDSFWLNDEERTCQTYPDAKGRVATVACSASGSHRDHNIPVKFWGGVDRNTISNWKCRREGDNFVCRAID